MMKSLLLTRPGEFSYEEREVPKNEEGSLLVKVDAVCICGSDTGAILGKNALFTYPRVLGHEVCGTVYEVSQSVKDFSVGDRVCLLPCISCGKCRACQKGKTNACSELKLYGVKEDGGLSEFMTAPAGNWMKIPETLSSEEGAMIEPLAIGSHAVGKLDLEKGDRVLVVGAGPIGVSAALNARIKGADVYLSDVSDSRADFVKRTFGFDVFNPLSETYEKDLLSVTDGSMFDAVLDTSAAKGPMENSWKYIANGGKIVFVGICNGTLEIDGKGFHSRETSLFVTRNSTRKDFEQVLENILSGDFKPQLFITHRVEFEKAGETIKDWLNPSLGVFKGVVRF